MTLLSALTPHPPTLTGRRTGGEPTLWGGDGPGFEDALDLVNPLQHIPVVSTLYRKATGDDVSAGVSMVGGALLGGLPGLALAAGDALFQAATGQSAEDAALDMVTDKLPDPFGGEPSLREAFRRPGAVPLTPDAGEALFAMALSGAPAPAEAKDDPTPVFLDLGPFRAASAEKQTEARHTRLEDELADTALRM